MKKNDLPAHVAIVMDGNGRWAQQRSKSRSSGHREGVKAVRIVIEECIKRKIKVLTLFAFSSENWKRPKMEVTLLLELFSTVLDRELKQLDDNNIVVNVIGDMSAFPKKLQEKIADAKQTTAKNNGLLINIAANYGGRWDIVNAVKLLNKQREKDSALEVSQQNLAKYMQLANQPEPDLFIRTGGEKRISNFLLWQLAYTELYFVDELWPDFNAKSFKRALDNFSIRQRRYGLTAEQV